MIYLTITAPWIDKEHHDIDMVKYEPDGTLLHSFQANMPIVADMWMLLDYPQGGFGAN